MIPRPDPLRRPLAVTLLAAALAFYAVSGFFGREMLAEAAIFAIFAMSLDLLVGYAGMVSLGHAAFFGLGAYATAGLTIFAGWPLAVAMPAAVALSGLGAFVVGFFCVRLSGVFFIMITLAFSQMFHAWFFKDRAFGGDDGLGGIPRFDFSALGLDMSDPTYYAPFVLVLAVGSLLVMDAVGVSISPLLAGLGLGGFAIALALQPLLSNIFASSYVITDASIAVGDYVEVAGGPTGVVEDIGWRATRIRTFDNNISMVPNAAVADSIITNYDSADARADARVDCGIAYEEDLERVEALVLEELFKLLELDYVDQDRTPLFRYSEFADSNINFFVKMRAVTWGDSFLLKHEMMKRIHSRLVAEGVVINYPARRLMLASEDVEGFERLGSALRGGGSAS